MVVDEMAIVVIDSTVDPSLVFPLARSAHQGAELATRHVLQNTLGLRLTGRG